MGWGGVWCQVGVWWGIRVWWGVVQGGVGVVSGSCADLSLVHSLMLRHYTMQ